MAILNKLAAPAACGSLQAKVDAARAGGTVDLPEGCIYREQVTIAKPITLQGGPGVEIRGSDVWTAWDRVTAGWRSLNTLPTFPQEYASCEPNTTRCAWPEQVFINGVAQTQMSSGSALNAGQFFVDSNRRVVIGTDPNGQTVEVTARRHWVTGTAAADNVTIEGFTMKHAANEWRSGGIINRLPTTKNADGSFAWSRFKSSGSKWTIKNNTLTDAHGAILSVKDTTGHQILDNEIARGGQLGIHNVGNNSIIQGNYVHNNNTEWFCFRTPAACTNVATDGTVTIGPGVLEAGGMKLAGWLRNVTVDENTVAHNKGNGVWFDVNTHDIAISNNRVHHNDRRGIFFEISDGARIFDNVLYENGWTTPSHVDGAGIGIGNSSNVQVYSNTLAWNADGIAVVGLNRDGTSWDRVHDVYVHDNAILAEDRPGDPRNNFALAWLQGWSLQMFDPLNNNRGAYNSYWYPAPEGSWTRYEWRQTSYAKLAQFNATLGEEGGRYLTSSEKDAVVANKGLPTSPEPH
jgi:parallel beta-helix repeat protein